jgi:hypothetical protein
MIGATRIGAAVLLMLAVAACGREEWNFIVGKQQFGPFQSEQDCNRIRQEKVKEGFGDIGSCWRGR